MAASMVDQSGIVASISQAVGATEPAIRLLLSIIAGYPIAAFYRAFIVHLPSKSLHHIFFTLSGLSLCYFNYGFDTYHSVAAIGATYLFTQLLHNAPRQLLIVNFTFHMAYLLIGYYFTESNDYDILWTMPHCVLVLRLIGFGFDVADGRKPTEQLSKEQQETALEKLPTILELFAFAYFPSSFLVGPQFPYRRYQKFIDGEFRQYTGSIETGVKRMLLGVFYLGVRQVGGMWFPDSYFLTDAFRNETFMLRIVYLGFWAKFALYKYISIWLLTEGSLMCIGFSYAGKTADGQDDWYGCSNVKLMLLETGYTMQHYVQSFNVNTNHWVAQYVYKRLKFLNNRTMSYAGALAFLAVWHGFHSGYYMSFLIEYMIVTTEKQIESAYTESVVNKYGHILNNSLPYKLLYMFVLKSYNIIYMGWCMTPFGFLSYQRWGYIFSAVNYYGFVYLGIWFVIHQAYQYNKRSATRASRAAPVATDSSSPKQD